MAACVTGTKADTTLAALTRSGLGRRRRGIWNGSDTRPYRIGPKCYPDKKTEWPSDEKDESGHEAAGLAACFGITVGPAEAPREQAGKENEPEPTYNLGKFERRKHGNSECEVEAASQLRGLRSRDVASRFCRSIRSARISEILDSWNLQVSGTQRVPTTHFTGSAFRDNVFARKKPVQEFWTTFYSVKSGSGKFWRHFTP